MDKRISKSSADKLEKELLGELEKARDASQEAFNNAPPDLLFQDFNDYMEETSKKVTEASRKYRMVKTPKFYEISTFGSVMSLEDFKDCVKSGGFIDYDGWGYYVKDGMESDIVISPSDVKHGAVRKDFDTIIWFNR